MLKLLGPPKLEAHDFSRPVPLLVLAYLAYEGGKHNRRDVASLFWPEYPLDDLFDFPLQNDIINLIEANYDKKRSEVIVVSLGGLSENDRHNLEDAHATLKSRGFIANVLFDQGLGFASYKLTPQYINQLDGVSLSKLSRTNLRNVLHKLKSLGEEVIGSDGQYIWTTIETDLSRFRQAVGRTDVDRAFNIYKPFLQGIEGSLANSRFEIGNDLALWLSDARRSICSELRNVCIDDAQKQLGYGELKKVEQRVFTALDICNYQEASVTELEFTDQVLNILKRGSSFRSSEAQRKIQTLLLHDPIVGQDEQDIAPAAGPPHSLAANSPSTSDVAAINLMTWRISAQHLSPLLDVGAYDEYGRLLSNREDKQRSYLEALYVPSEESGAVDRFLKSAEVGLFLIGPSGSGKSNLLCHSFLNERRKGNLTVFLSARLLYSSDFASCIESQVFKSTWKISQSKSETFEAWLSRTKTPLLIYLDAINEHNIDRGPLALLESVIGSIRNSHSFSNMKLVISCRTETWKNYKEVFGGKEPLKEDVAGLSSANVVFVDGFDSERSRKRLFDTYQKHYALSPKRYEAQNESLRQLIKTPFMMSVIAESYSNRGSAVRKMHIPAQLDYPTIFRTMTQRKLRDSRNLLNPNDPKRSIVERVLSECLFAFAELVYKKLVAGSTTNESEFPKFSEEFAETYTNRADALSVDELTTPEIRLFMESFSLQSTISPFAVLVQLGLLKELTITTTDLWGVQSEVTAYQFYHDQYAQFWLSAVLSQNVLGRVNTEMFAANKGYLTRTSEKIAWLLDEAKVAPLLAGAVEAWLYMNMVNKRKVNDYLVELFNDLTTTPSGLVSYHVGIFLNSLVDRNIVSARQLYQNLFAKGHHPLKQAMAYTYLEVWPKIKPGTLRAFLDALDAEADIKTIHMLADIFVELYRSDSARVIRLFDKTLSNSDSPLNFLTSSLIKRQSVIKQLTFIAQFGLKVFHYSSSSDYDAPALKEFLLRRYSYPLQALVSNKSLGLQAQLKPLLYKKLEDSGINSWEQASRVQGNELFFDFDSGTVQRDILHDYYRYVVALHNGENKLLSFHDNADFRETTLQMLSFRAGSVIGYVAMMVASILISEDASYFDLLLSEMLARDSEASRFSLGVIATQAVYFDPRLAPFVLDKLQHQFVRHQLSYGYESEEVVFSFISVAATDIDRLGAACLDTLDEVMQNISAANSPERAAAFGDRLANSNFHPDPKIGLLIVKHLLERGGLDDKLWRSATLRTLAGMLARDPKVVHELLEARDKTGSELDAVRQHLDSDLLLRKDQVSYQMSWNLFFVSGWKSKKLNFYIVRDLLGGLVQSNSVTDFAKGYRRFFVEMAKDYLDEQGQDYSKLSATEALNLAESSRKEVKPQMQNPAQTGASAGE